MTQPWALSEYPQGQLPFSSNVEPPERPYPTCEQTYQIQCIHVVETRDAMLYEYFLPHKKLTRIGSANF